MAKTTKAKRLRLHSKTGPLTPEEQLKADRDSWRADVYQHFHPAQIAKDEDGNIEYYEGEIIYLFVCKRYAFEPL